MAISLCDKNALIVIKSQKTWYNPLAIYQSLRFAKIVSQGECGYGSSIRDGKL